MLKVRVKIARIVSVWSVRVPKKAAEKPAKPAPAAIVPEQIEPSSLADYFEVLTIAVFQAGVSWAMILNRLDGFRRAFEHFDPARVAKFTDADVVRLMEDPGIVHIEKKIRATITNAKTIVELDRKHGGFKNYLRSFPNYKALEADLRKHFKYFGELSVYYFLFRCGESVPVFEDWIVTIEGDHPRMREMVDAARKRGLLISQ